MDVLDIVLDVVHEEVAVNIFDFAVGFKFVEDIFVGFGLD